MIGGERVNGLGNVNKWAKQLLLGVLAALLLASPSLAKNPGWVPSYIEGESALQLGSTQAEPSLEAPGLSDRDELATFIDQVVADELDAESAPVAAIAVMNNGEIFGGADSGDDCDRPVELAGQRLG
jgi:hypothetical protein